MGRVGKKPKKNSCKGKCKEEGKEKKLIQKEGPIVTFSESLSFRNQQYYLAQIFMNKSHFLLIERRQLEPCFCFKLQLVYLQHTLYTVL